MHHLFLLLIILALILFFFLPWHTALLLSVVIIGVVVTIFSIFSRMQPIRLIGAPSRPMIGSRALVIKARGNDAEVQ